MLRRVLAAVLAVFVLAVTGATAAAGAPADPGGWCSTSPTPTGNGDTLGGALDLGAPPATAQGGGTYTRTGWAGWGSPHIFDPGCGEKLARWVAGKVTTGAVDGLVKADPYNTVAGWYLGGAAVIGAGLTLLVRAATEPGVVWDAIDLGEGAARSVAGWHIYAAWVTSSFLAVGLWFLARARKDSLDKVWSQNATALLMLVTGLIVAGYQVSVGSSVDAAIQGTFRASGQVATGAPSPSSAFADMYVDGILLPGWSVVHLGMDLGAVEEFGPRLYAAATMTRAEEAAVAADPAAKKRLAEAKDRDYRQVAAEVKAKYPDAYDHLAGRPDMRDARMGWALLVLVLVLPLAVVVAVLAGAVAFARITLRYAFAVWPGVSVIVSHPVLQAWGRVFATEVVKWLWLGCLSVVAMVGYLRVVTGIVTAPQQIPWMARLIAAFGLSVWLIWLWRRKRSDLIGKARLEREAATVRWANQTARDAYRRVRGRDDDRSESRGARASGTTDDAPPSPARDMSSDVHASLSGTGPDVPDAPAGGVREVVAERAARKAHEEARAVDVARVPVKAATADVSAAAARLASARPSESTLARRESAALTARTARALPAKRAATATTSVQSTSRAAVRVAANRIGKRAAATTATVTTGPAAGAARIAAAATAIKSRRRR